MGRREKQTADRVTKTRAEEVTISLCLPKKKCRSISGLGNYDDGEGHYIFTFTTRGHYAYTKKYLKIADLQAQNASRFELVDLLFLDTFGNWKTIGKQNHFLLFLTWNTDILMHLYVLMLPL